jgi:hypothetical protein
MKRLVLLLGVIGMVALAGRPYAGEMDVLLGKLVDKGILTASEAQEIRTETNDEVAKQEKVKQEDYKKLAKDSLPDWVKNIKLKGDLRTRYQYDQAKNATSVGSDRHRARIRMRLGAETKLIDDFKVGLGISTGTTSDPRSTNVTLGDTFSFKSIVLNHAYGEYSPGWTSPVETSFIAGKFANPIWEPTDMLWDTDINPEGAALKLGYKLDNGPNLFLNSFFGVLDENASDKDDPIMWAIQPGLDWDLMDNVNLKGAVDFYVFNGIKGHPAMDFNSGTNTLAIPSDQNRVTGTRVYSNSYNSVNPKVEIGFKEPLSFAGLNSWVPYLGFFGEYIDNFDADEKNNAWAAGFKFGHSKISKLNDWQLCYNYRFLEKDAWPDVFPDSDFYSGRTNTKGHNVILQYGLSKNSFLNLEYYYAMNMTRASADPGSSRLPAQVLQADWSIKF